ncbi:MAG: alkaline phosphatase family protein [Candidatus Dormibacteria bacterium]
MEENQGYAATQENCGPSNSYFCWLATDYASVVDWYGVTHPSLPNYLAITSGDTQGCSSDDCGSNTAANLGQQLTAADIPWVAYMESMPTACDQSDAGEYAYKHNPFPHYSDLSAAVCQAHDLPYPPPAGLLSALDGPNPPDFVWITPNLIDDMHDGSVSQGNAWLQANLAPVLLSPWFLDYRSTVIVTEDEGSGGSCCGGAGQGGQIPDLIISANARGKGPVAITGDHYGTLWTLEQQYQLPALGAASAGNGNLSSLFG